MDKKFRDLIEAIPVLKKLIDEDNNLKAEYNISGKVCPVKEIAIHFVDSEHHPLGQAIATELKEHGSPAFVIGPNEQAVVRKTSWVIIEGDALIIVPEKKPFWDAYCECNGTKIGGIIQIIYTITNAGPSCRIVLYGSKNPT